VDPGSPAAQSGLRQGDIIVGVNRTPIKNVAELKSAAKDANSLVLSIRRGNATLLVPVR
jgi:S1-C subfamily serine protease